MSRLPDRRGRVVTVAAVLASVMVLLVVRAVDLAVLRGHDFAARAQGQHQQAMRLVPQRGDIVDRNGELLAVSLDVPSLFVRPREFEPDRARVPELARALGTTVEHVRRVVDRPAPFVWLKRQALPRQHDAVMALGLRGVGAVQEPRRVYPHGSLAAHVLGYVGTDAQGLGGIEMRFDRLIRGEPRRIAVERDAMGREFARDGLGPEPAAGSRVELALDARIQAATEHALADGVAKARAVGGAAVVLDPWTGDLLALANHPTFNPNDPDDWGAPESRGRLGNRAITDPYEPGSTFKAFLAAAALEERVVRTDELVFCENGDWQVGKWTINDAHPHGTLSFAEVIQFSSNIGVSKIAERLGRERYGSYLRRFGFGEASGIELAGESGGIVRDPATWARIDLVVQSFGQGISVTPLQMVAAYAAIANGGNLVRPHAVRRIVRPDGSVQREAVQKPLRRVMSEQTAHVTTELLRRVVEEKGGTGSKARLEEFPVAGKTGTAQKVNPNGGGYSSKRIGSFVGFVPADDPRAVILVLIDEPQGVTYGGVVAAPVFREIAKVTMKVLGVTPRVQAGPSLPPVQAARRPERRPRIAAGPARGRAVDAASEVASIPPTVPEVPADATPSYLGLSRREALTRAHAEGWAVEVRGTGWVWGQEPAPGAPAAQERRLALELRPDRGVAQP